MTVRERSIARSAVGAVFFANGFGYGAWIAHLPLFKTHLALSDGAIGLSLLGGSCASLVTMPLIGRSIGRIGSRSICIAASLCAGATLVLPFFAPNGIAFAVAIVVIGATYSAFDVAINAQAVALQREYARPILSSFHAVFSFAGLIGAAFSAAMISRGLGLERDGATFAILCLLVALAAAFGLVRDAPNRDATARAPRDGTMPAAWRDPALLSLGMLAFLGLVGEGAMADWSGIYLRTSLGVGAAASAIGFGAFSVMMGVGRATGDAIVGRFGPRRTLVAGAALAALALAFALLVHAVWSAYLGFALVGIGLANVVPIVFGRAGADPRVPPGVGIATVSTVGYVGFLVGPPAIGLAADRFGIHAALALVVLSIAGAALLASQTIANGASSGGTARRETGDACGGGSGVQ